MREYVLAADTIILNYHIYIKIPALKPNPTGTTRKA